VSDYAQIIAGLAQPEAYPHPVDRFAHIETHASHVFLVGDLAYKLKKPVNLGFLDFGTLQRRRYFCEEELRLNRRLAPDTYLGVVAITGTPAAPRVGGDGEALEYAVKMRRFPQNALLTRRRVTPDIVDRIADRVAAFHEVIPIAAPESGHGRPQSVLAPMLENLAVLHKCPAAAQEAECLSALEAWTLARFPGLTGLIEHRRLTGRVRECHGDLHRGNIAEVSGQLIIFDGIEFDPDLRWIDTINEVAFFAMDLAQGGAPELAQRFLNRYLERNGDYEGVALLDLYRVYRATVRAKVTAIRLSQPGLEANEVLHHRRELRRYLALTDDFTGEHPRRLILTHGRSGSGKTHLCVILRERLRAIHIRSDIERKRLFGLPPEARAAAAVEGGIYRPEATDRTYARLLNLARAVLTGGWSVLVDATFLRYSQRTPFLALAEELGVPVTVLCLHAPEAVLRARVAKRIAEGCDASDADVTILAAQSAVRQPLTQEEGAYAIQVYTHPAPDLDDLLRQLID